VELHKKSYHRSLAGLYMPVNKMDAGYTDNRLEKKYGGCCGARETVYDLRFYCWNGEGGMEIEVDFELLNCKVIEWILTEYSWCLSKFMLVQLID